MEAVAEIEERMQSARGSFAELKAEIARAIVGHEELIEQVFIALVCGGHCLLEGVPGLGKTLMVRSFGEALSLSFSRIQFTPDLMPADITGTNVLTDDPSGRKVFEFQRGPVFAHIVLADEINRATPKTQSALLEAMQEQSVTVGGKAHRLENPFMVLATQNPIEMEGTYPLPEAQVDRFFFKLLLNYPRRERDDESGSLVRKFVLYGSSPRGLQSLILAAKARALLSGRPNVSFEDLCAMLPPSLCHRLILNLEADAEGINAGKILDEILTQVPEVI